MPTVTAGQKAPAFELKGTDGKNYLLEEVLARAPVLAAFFKVSCPTCQFTFPFVERLYQQLRGAGVQIWGISQDNVRDSQRFAKEFGVTFPLLIDDEPYEVSSRYELTRVPTLVFINRQGQVEIVSEGFAKSELVEIGGRLAGVYSQKPPELFRPDEKIPEFKPG